MFRHHPLIAKLERLVGAGKIGRVDSVNATFRNFDAEEDDPTDPDRNWSHDTERAGESAGAVLMEGFMFRHHPLIAKLERLVGAGKIGVWTR